LEDAIEKGVLAKQKAQEKILGDYLLEKDASHEANLEIEAPSSCSFVPIICMIDNYDEISKDVHPRRICRVVITKLYSYIGKVLYVNLGKTSMLFVICAENKGLGTIDVLNECQQLLLQSQISTSYIIGKAQSSIMDVKESYYEMQRLMFMSVCFDDGSIVSGPIKEDNVNYPASEVTALIGCINSDSREKIAGLLEKAFENLEGKKSPLVPLYILQMVLSIIIHITSINGDKDMLDYQDAIDKIGESPNLSTAKKLLHLLCFDACDYMKARQKPNLELDITKYMNENFSNPDLSLTYISDIFGYSPKYMGRVFNNCTGLFFTQFLTDIRMKKAQELVMNTDMTNLQISEAVGILNEKQFYRLFRKQFGISPSVMRKSENMPDDVVTP